MTDNGQPKHEVPLGPLVGGMLLTILLAKVDQRGGVWIMREEPPELGSPQIKVCFFCKADYPEHDDCVWTQVEQWGREVEMEALEFFGIVDEEDLQAFLAGLEGSDDS